MIPKYTLYDENEIFYSVAKFLKCRKLHVFCVNVNVEMSEKFIFIALCHPNIFLIIKLAPFLNIKMKRIINIKCNRKYL